MAWNAIWQIFQSGCLLTALREWMLSSQYKDRLSMYVVFHYKIRPPWDRLIFIMEILIGPLFSEICWTHFLWSFRALSGPLVVTWCKWPGQCSSMAKRILCGFWIMNINPIVWEITFQTRCEAWQTVHQIAGIVTACPRVLFDTLEPEVFSIYCLTSCDQWFYRWENNVLEFVWYQVPCSSILYMEFNAFYETFH